MKYWVAISILHILTNLYDENNVCTPKIEVELFSVYSDISFDNKKSEKITDISFPNRNNRNKNNNRNKLQKMFKMDSILIGHKAGILFCYLRHISLQNEMINIHKFEKNCNTCKNQLL